MSVGYAAAYLGLLRGSAADGLIHYVFNLAIPLLVFRSISDGAWPDVSPWGYWLAYFSGVAVVWLLTSAIARIFLRTSGLVAAMAGCGASYSNTVMLGLPLVLTAFGSSGSVPLMLLLSVHLPIMLAMSLISGELLRRDEEQNWYRLLWSIVLSIGSNPIFIGIVSALSWRSTGWGVPFAVDEIINRIADTAVPCALIAMGTTLARYGIRGEVRLIGVMVFGKLILHPLIVYTVASFLGLPPIWIGVMTLFAAAPTGVNAYVVASRYQAGVSAVSGAILLSAAVSVVTIGVLLRYLHLP